MFKIQNTKIEIQFLIQNLDIVSDFEFRALYFNIHTMLEFQEKKKLRDILYSKITLVAIFVILVFIARATFNVYYKQKANEENLTKAKEEFAELKKREKMLNSEINRLKTDKGVEEEVRKKFMVGKAGERVIVIVNDDESNKSSTDGNSEKKNIWSKFLNFFR